jgi:hypothetical protein
MKKIIIAGIVFFTSLVAQAQENEVQENGNQVSKGKWLIEANTGFGQNVGNTSLYFKTTDGITTYNIGLEGGYFIKDNLAIKVGLGYGDDGVSTLTDPIAYKLGLKYYFKSKIPVEISYNGVGFGDKDANPTYIGLQAGYAFFLGKNVSVEPGIRYNSAVHKQFYDSSFQFNIGFALHL